MITKRPASRIEKAGWIALALGLLAVLVAFAVFLYVGPGAAQREIACLSSAPVFTAVVEPAVQLHASLPDGASLAPTDARGDAVRRALAPADCSFIAKRGGDLFIECGGGFLHYGYRLARKAAGRYVLVLEVEEKPGGVLVTQDDRP